MWCQHTGMYEQLMCVSPITDNDLGFSRQEKVTHLLYLYTFGTLLLSADVLAFLTLWTPVECPDV
jgi:hypothetical protein